MSTPFPIEGGIPVEPLEAETLRRVRAELATAEARAQAAAAEVALARLRLEVMVRDLAVVRGLSDEVRVDFARGLLHEVGGSR